MDKPLTLDELKAWRENKDGVVCTNGCFDILHVGHVRTLQTAKNLGKHLVVGVNSDESIRKLKGADRPINSEVDRCETLLALRMVDVVCVFTDQAATEFIRICQSNTYVKGGDYKKESLNKEELDVLEEVGGELVIAPVVNGISTTKIINKLKRG